MVPADFARELERENARLRAALLSIWEMPEYDQDDAHRLRAMGRNALRAQ